MMRTIRLLICLAVVAAPLVAQPPLARVTLGGGSATDLRGVRSGAYMLVPSVTFFTGSGLTMSLRGRGTRYTSDEWSAGGGASLEGRVPLGARLGLLLSGSGDAIYASYHATYLQADATPGLELGLGSVSVWAGAHGAVARTSIRQALLPPAGVPGGAPDVVMNRSALGPAFGATIDVTSFAPGEGVRLTYREEHGRPDGIAVIDRVAAALIARGPVLLSGSLGQREARGENRTFGGGQMVLTVAHGVAVFAAAESYPSNRLTGAVGGRSFSGGIALSAGGFHAPRALPRPTAVPAAPAGLTRLSIEARRASRVEVAGDWNGWEPVPLRRAENGVWYADLEIPPGEYRYAFRVDGRTWEVPKGVAAVDDGFGGKSAWLSVPGSGRKAAQSANRKEES
jgi:hypothetical protein